MKQKSAMLFLCVSVAWFAPTPAQADAPYSTGFETDTVGQYPAGWIVKYKPTLMEVVDQRAFTGQQSLQLTGEPGSARALEYIWAYTPGSDWEMTFSYRIDPVTDNTSLIFYQAGLRGDTNGFLGTSFMVRWIDGKYQATAHTAGSYDERLREVQSDQWYTVHATFNGHNTTSDWYLDGKLLVDDRTYVEPTTEIMRFYFNTGADNWITGQLDDLTLRQTNEVSPSAQKVVLNWHDASEQDFTSVGGKIVPGFGTMGPSSIISQSAQTEQITQQVEAIFRSSGIQDIEVISSTAPGQAYDEATVIYFSDDDLGDGQPGRIFQGGPDRYNRNKSAAGVVFDAAAMLDANPDLLAETIAHQVGHTLGLLHGQGASIMSAQADDQFDGVFTNAVLTGTGWDDTTAWTHNPRSHLEAYVDGQSDNGMQPGSWDLPDSSLGLSIIGTFTRGQGAIYNAVLYYQVKETEIVEILGKYEQFTFDDLIEVLFEMPEGVSLRLAAASSKSGPIDTMLSLGDPLNSQDDVRAVEGQVQAYLQTLQSDGSYQTTAELTIIGTPIVVPEPATIALLALGGLTIRRRKNG